MKDFITLRIIQYDDDKLIICKSTNSNKIYLLAESQFIELSYRDESIDYLMEQESTDYLNDIDNNIGNESFIIPKKKSVKKKIKNSKSFYHKIECEKFNLFNFLEI